MKIFIVLIGLLRRFAPRKVNSKWLNEVIYAVQDFVVNLVKQKGGIQAAPHG
jgi:hypothetical protein